MFLFCQCVLLPKYTKRLPDSSQSNRKIREEKGSAHLLQEPRNTLSCPFAALQVKGGVK